jgi:cellulose synthase/poly-beta-1,6-N-acetylglucosamine synthase-like glycosyltransferase
MKPSAIDFKRLAVTAAFFGGLVLALLFVFDIFERFWVFTVASFVFFYLSAFFILTINSHSVEDPKPKKYLPLTVVIPAYNASATIRRCVNSVKKMRYPRPFEIIVVDDSSTDDTYNLIKSDKALKIVRRTKNRGKGSALNLAMRMAKGELIANIDSDTFPEPDALEKMVGYFNDPKTGAVTTVICVDRPKNFLQRVQEIEYYVAFGFWHKAQSFLDALMVTPGPMSIYRKKALLDAGGFDEENITEDHEIALHLQELGYKIKVSVNTRVSTVVPDNLKHYFRQRIRWYRGKVFNGAKYRHLFFNPKLGDFSIIYPASFLVETLSIVVLFGVILVNGEGIYNWTRAALLAIATNSVYIDWDKMFRIDLLTLPPYVPLLGLMAAIWAYKISKSLGFVDKGFRLAMLPQFIFYMFMYSFFITGAYIMGLYKEVNRSEQTW